MLATLDRSDLTCPSNAMVTRHSALECDQFALVSCWADEILGVVQLLNHRAAFCKVRWRRIQQPVELVVLSDCTYGDAVPLELFDLARPSPKSLANSLEDRKKTACASF